MYDEQRYQKPSDINHLVMCIDGSDGIRYYLCFDDLGNAIVRGGNSPFMATLEYVVANGILHAMTDNGTMLDHKVSDDVWIKFRKYCGEFTNIPQNKYIAWLNS